MNGQAPATQDTSRTTQPGAKPGRLVIVVSAGS
jgi:hypothetical protein